MPTTTDTTTETLTELLMHLVRMPTVSSDPATNRAAMDWVENQLQDLPLTIKRHERNGVPSLTATTAAVKDPKAPKLWLAAHTDVVPGTPAMFEPRIADGRIYGRGTHDMKFAIATYLLLLHELGDLGNYDLGLMLTADEEIGSLDGVGWLAGELGYRGQTVLLPDSVKTWEVETGHKGTAYWHLTAHGKEAHGSRTWEGDNAILRLFNFITELRKHTVAEPCGDPKHNHNTINIGKINGGNVVNQVPARAEADIDIRLTRGATLDDAADWVHQAQLAVPHVDAVQLDMQIKPTELPQTAPVLLFAGLAEAAIGRPMERVYAHGGTDARWFTNHGIPVITVAPTGGGFHTGDEWVDQAEVTRFYEVTRQFVERYAKV